jgi:RNA polymerase I-specific transcription initiation factor RRN3
MPSAAPIMTEAVLPIEPPVSILKTKMLEFSSNMYKAYVQNALDQLLDNNTEPINNLAYQLSLPATSSEAMSQEQILNLISALTSEISRLDSYLCGPVINGVLKLKWSNREPQFVAAYVRFLMVLVSGIPKWWPDVANKIVAEFVVDDTGPHHSVLSYIVRVIPTSSSTLQGVFMKQFPHKSDSTKNFINYVRNLLRVVEYCRELEKGVWGLILERTVALDVELYDEVDNSDSDDDDDDDDDDEEVDEVDEEEEEEEEDDDEDDDDQDVMEVVDGQENLKEGTVEEVDNDNDDDDDTASDVSEYDVGDMQNDTVSIREKLDGTLCLLFEHLESKFCPERLVLPETIQLFSTLLDLFKSYVLPTHRTRSVQYVLFRTCHSHNDLLDAFLASMIELALSPNENIERRQKAMQYISSFIARAKGLSKAQIVFVVSFLAGWLDRYIRDREVEVDHAMGGMGRFRMFYSVCQALFYIFCFRHSTLHKNDGWECDLDALFQRLIVTKFNPLRYCKRTVVAMFARIAQRHNVAYCFTIMEQNRLGGFKHESKPTTPLGGATSYFGVGSSMWSKSQEFVALEGYFPFDPLALRGAKQSVREMYVEWDDVADDSDSGSEQECDDDQDHEVDDEKDQDER